MSVLTVVQSCINHVTCDFQLQWPFDQLIIRCLMCVIHWFFNIFSIIEFLTCSNVFSYDFWFILNNHTSVCFTLNPSFIINDSSIGQVLYWQGKGELNTWERHDCIVSLGASQPDFSPNRRPLTRVSARPFFGHKYWGSPPECLILGYGPHIMGIVYINISFSHNISKN